MKLSIPWVRSIAACVVLALQIPQGAPAAAQDGQWRRVWPVGAASYRDVAMGSALDAWIATAVGGVRHTTTGGVFWTEQQLPTNALAAIAAKGSLVCAVGEGILRSTDAGQIWSTVNPATGLEDVHFATASLGWAVGSVGRVFRTLDGGASWTQSSLPGVGATLRAVHFVNGNQGWVVGDSGLVWRTLNGGAQWSPLSAPSAAHFTDVFFADAARGWIAAGNAVLRTVDGGLNWISAVLPPGARADRLSVLGGQWLWATGTPGLIVASTDGGGTWSTQAATSGVALLDVSMGDLSTGLAVGVDGGVFKTTDGGAHWSLLGGGAPVATELAFDVVRRGTKVWAALTDSVILRSDDAGESWTETGAGLPQTQWRAIDFLDDSVGYAVGERQGFYPTTAWTQDGGLTWNPTYWSGMYDFWDVDAVSPGVALACADNGLWRSTNGGVGWTFLNTTPLSGFFAADFVDANLGWAVGYDVMMTVDGGASWTWITTPTEVLRDVAFADALHGWAVGDNGTVLATVDGGNSWTPQDASTAAGLWTVEALSSTTAWIAGTTGFVARTTDGGATWLAVPPPGLGSSDCYGSSFDGPDSGFLTGFYPVSSVWKRTPPTCHWNRYCQGKVSSNGLVPQLEVLGLPSAAASPMVVRATQAVPNAVGLVIFSKLGPAALPFGGALLCAAPPVSRLPALVFDASGSASQAVGVTSAMAGSTRWYQLWQRDAQHPDGTGITLSDGLAVTFCP